MIKKNSKNFMELKYFWCLYMIELFLVCFVSNMVFIIKRIGYRNVFLNIIRVRVFRNMLYKWDIFFFSLFLVVKFNLISFGVEFLKFDLRLDGEGSGIVFLVLFWFVIFNLLRYSEFVVILLLDVMLLFFGCKFFELDLMVIFVFLILFVFLLFGICFDCINKKLVVFFCLKKFVCIFVELIILEFVLLRDIS